MECRQLLCILCLLELAGFAAGSTTATPSPAGTARDSGRGTASTATAATAATGDSSSAQPTSAAATAGSAATSPTPPELLGQLRSSPPPSAAPTALLGSSPGVPTSRSPPSQPGDSALTSGPPSSAATPEHPAVPAATTALHSSPQPALRAISCHGARDQGDTGAICLQLNESSTCEHFLERKGLDLWQALCENRTHSVELPCEIKLTPSSLDRDCLLLILKGEKDPDKLLNTLQKSHWEKFGIESLKKESTRSRRDPSQRTLIALVTSGLLLAFLGLAGYFLMRRRSWSPAGQRLAEDPYYTENGSQGNTMLMSPSQEPAEPQEKPNLNGGTQENGTGSKNGRSGRQHSPADTEM
ncbi:hematopoietic progenitor cell antigen CD34 [Pyrgilauda ruficollis]|uniref:hematopoietic progenitor cell antigen CD34 n=1 Tax=Pyrgilauda ruficollis TaxID=221976 RepID=UPI001B86C9A5|nr:hematopoietic progenitor cell antigen CD34 [Pyrgilauda ruficollis]